MLNLHRNKPIGRKSPFSLVSITLTCCCLAALVCQQLVVEAAESTKATKQSSVQKKIAPEIEKSSRVSATHSSSAAAEQQQEQLSRIINPKSDQVSADKKQGDHHLESSSASQQQQQDSSSSSSSSFGPDEYVQIKPEEINEASSAAASKDLDSSVALASEPQPQIAPAAAAAAVAVARAEHKSAVDDELNAHLAATGDTISSIESIQQPYAATDRAHYAPQPSMMRAPPKMMQQYHHYGPPPPMVRAPPRMRMPRGPHYGMVGASPLHHQQQQQQQHRMPPSYITLKGKLTGINSLISQYPHPAPGYPHQGPRHLPRGAAAGYAAFRDFVRAHASKYKQPAPSLEGPTSMGDYNNGQHQARDPAASTYNANKHTHMPPPPPPSSGYAEGSNNGYSSSSSAPSKGNSYRQQGAKATKVTVAQAYIPHLAPSMGASQETGNYGSAAGASSAVGPYGSNPMLTKLYGAHAPQGVGRPEYNKDYGMVIHYPQATVYTEPMTVDQLHKLTGAGISQVLSQLQHNLANGHRDESNTLRSNNHHHLGNGLTIHAKEYYAPDKGGRYVPTTAAIISTGPNAKPDTSSYGSATPVDSSASGYGQMGGSSLGAGYERVKQAVAASEGQRYNNAHGDQYNQQQSSAQQYSAQTSTAYDTAASTSGTGPNNAAKQYSNNNNNNGEPLSSITNFIGSELEALYKANQAFTKQIEPELQAQLDAYTKSMPKTPLRYTELDQHKPTLSLEHITKGLRGYAASGSQQQHPVAQTNGGNRYGGQAMHKMRLPRRHANRVNRYRSQGPQQQQQHYMQQGGRQTGYGAAPGGAYQQQQHQQRQPNHMSGQYQQQQQQQQQMQAYQATEQALNNQMMQLLRDFHAGDDQYNSQQLRTINQGYPHKVMQKQQNGYNQQQQQQQQQHQNQGSSIYNQHEGLEIPQGPNDQIGEIAELIEALKGTLESHRPADGPSDGSYGNNNQKQAANTLEDVRYLASALGQTPSYAVQVPVNGGAMNEDASKKGAYQQVEQQQQQQQFAYQQSTPVEPTHQQTLNKPLDSGYQQSHQAANEQGYGQQQAYGSQGPASGYGGAQQAYGQQQQQQVPTQAEYSSAVQQVRAAAGAQQYGGQQQTPVGANNVAAGSYPQQQSAEHAQQQSQEPANGYQQQQQQQPSAAAGYSSTEHTQVINHLVPLGQQQPSGGYETQATHQQQQQPVNQIAVAAPTDAQYQQAQSLSSFVDSLPTDYQELLRQPALEGHSSATAHLAALGQEQAAAAVGYSTSGSGYNATVATPHSLSASHILNGHEINQQPSYGNQQQGEQAQQQHHQAATNQQYSSSASASSSSSSSRRK